MPLFPSISKDERLSQAFAKFNTGIEKPLLELHQVLMRSDDSPFTEGQRELIAAYVSGIMNDCGYCATIHTLVAEGFGVQEGLIDSLVEDIESSSIDDKLKPVLRFVKKLTLQPTKMLKSDADAVFNAGWDERALYDALAICCTWNFMNRFVEGLGLEVSTEQYKDSAKMLMEGYDLVIDKFGLK